MTLAWTNRGAAVWVAGLLLLGGLGSTPAVGSEAAAEGDTAPSWLGGSRRIGGADRYETAVAALDDHRHRYPNEQVRGRLFTALVATGANFPDALAAGNLGLQMPIVLAPPGGLTPSMAALLAEGRLEAAFIMGDQSVVSSQVEHELQAMGVYIEFRAAGRDRYHTARLAAERTLSLRDAHQGNRPAPVVLATGTDFADALAVGPLLRAMIYGSGEPLLLLTTPDRLHADARAIIQRGDTGDVLVIGGTGAVSEDVAQSIRDMGVSVSRIGGANRYETAALLASRTMHLAQQCLPNDECGPIPSVVIARGDHFADALTAAATLPGQPLLLAESPTSLGETTRAWLEAHADVIDHVIVMGGPAAISDTVFEQAKAAATATR